MRYNNYHKHTHYSNIRTLDCISKPEDYIKRAVELGHTSYFTTEHGFQGNIFEVYTLCQQYGLKCIYAVEAYYVDDIYNKDNRTNYHIIIVAMNEDGRKEINSIMSIANTDGFYYKPRIDLKCLLSLTPENVVITTACVAGRLFKGDDWEDKFLIPVYKHFKNHFFLEVQNHNENVQIEYNKKILEVKKKYNIPLIHANDSHYILPNDSINRGLFLKAKGIIYEDESNFILDYPDAKTIAERYVKQNVLNKEQIIEALKNTLIFDESTGITLDKEFKIPIIKENFIKQELDNCELNYSNDDLVLSKIIDNAWIKEKSNIKEKRIKEYEDAIEYETNIVKKCGMARYFILDHIIVKRAIEKYNAILTRSGRGSSVSFYINHLLGLTEVDRLKAPITLYPTRFMSAERILNSRSLPDIDLNFADVAPVIQASKDILGDDGIYYMVAYKPLQRSSAFRLWCKANDYSIDEYDELAKLLGDKDYSDEEFKTEHPKWANELEGSKTFRGVIESIAPSPCSFLLLDKPISKEIGLIKVGNITCCALDGYNCDVYKYLKNDYLTVRVYEIINKVYKLIGRPIDNISTLINNCDDKVWDIYEKGLTTTINQSDSDFGKQTLKRYKPKSLAEMSAWVAAIRPGFASLLNTFLDREFYTTGVEELDNILEDSFHFMMYQESIMKYLVWLGMEEKGTYDVIKKIAKKKFKQSELLELQSSLEEGWIKNVGTKDGFNETWQVVQDAAHYSFNASHSLSVAIDSIYGAYLKSHYPLEYYSVVLTLYSGDMERTANLISELPYFGIKLETIKFGKSGSDYSMDKKNNIIYKGLSSVKYCTEDIANKLLELSKKKYKSFIDLLDDIKSNKILDTRQLRILTGLNFFSMFGKNKYLLTIIDFYNGIKDKSNKTLLPSLREAKVINIEKIYSYSKYGIKERLLRKYARIETAKQFRDIDNIGLLNELIRNTPNESMEFMEQCKFEKEYLEYITYINPDMASYYYIVLNFKTYKDSTRPSFTLKSIKTGEEIRTRIRKGSVFKERPFGEFSVLKVEEFVIEQKKKLVDDNWVATDEYENIVCDYEVMKNV